MILSIQGRKSGQIANGKKEKRYIGSPLPHLEMPALGVADPPFHHAIGPGTSLLLFSLSHSG